MKHQRREASRLTALLLLMAKHVDDLKLAGEKPETVGCIQKLESVFGKVKLEWHTFTNCGVRHVQNRQTKEVTLDQCEYAKALRTISHAELSGKKPAELCGPELHS
eukprot:2723120-Alexandrium_andersonii.AAC.1